MRLRDVMSHAVISLHPDDTVESAMRTFLAHGITGAPVVDHRRVVGVISEKDMFRALYPSVAEYYDSPELWMEERALEQNAQSVAQKRVRDIMTRDVVAAPADTPVMQAGAMMLAHRVHRLVVMEADKLVGVATRSDVFRNVFKQFFA